jgi:Ca2+-binding RTX toxin-like protein
MASPAWFDKDEYFTNKLEQLQTSDPAGNWTDASMKAVFDAVGYGTGADGAFRHFNDYGNHEEVSPNAFFKVDEYLTAKAAQLNALEGDAGYLGHLWNEALVLKAFHDAGLSAWDHYTRFGMDEGINPSNAFDNNAYLQAKLIQLQAADPDAEWTLDDVKAAFHEAGLNPVEHYFLFGETEGIPATAAAAPVTPDPDYNPYTPNQNPGTVYSLSTDTNNITGTAADDEITGVSATSKSAATLHTGDKIDGGAGNDVLKVDVRTSFTGFDNADALKNVETVSLTNAGTSATSFSAKGVDNSVETYNIRTNSKGNGVALSDLPEAGITVNEYGVKDSISIGFTTDAVKGSDDALTLGLSDVGTATKAVTVTSANIENLTVNAAGDNFVDLSGVAQAKSISVSSVEGDPTTVTAVGANVASFNASDAAGGVTADLSAATKLLTLNGGTGDDVFTIAKLDNDAVLYGGAGNDSLILKGAVEKLASAIISGFENITLDRTANNPVTIYG